MNKMFYAFSLCNEFRILAFINVILLRKKNIKRRRRKKRRSIYRTHRYSLGNIGFGSDLRSIMKTAVMIPLFDTEVKHRIDYRPL